MTNAIEQTKREMYRKLSKARATISRLLGPKYRLGRLESAIEAYLEELRKQYEEMADTARSRFESIQSLEQANQDLAARLSKMTEDRDGCQSRMQAIDHAYNEQQRKTGTCDQVCGDRGASEQPDAKTMAILGVVIDCQQLVSDWAVYGYRAKKQMKKMAYVLNNNPELRAALDHFEGGAK